MSAPTLLRTELAQLRAFVRNPQHRLSENEMSQVGNLAGRERPARGEHRSESGKPAFQQGSLQNVASVRN